jgi:polyphosphate kinase 2
MPKGNKNNGKNGRDGKGKKEAKGSPTLQLPKISKEEAPGYKPTGDVVRKKIEKLSRAFYDEELARLQYELVRLQYWVKQTGQRLVLIFEGRDAAGKGGTIRRITEPLNPRGVRLVALSKPSDVERTQWYFQRYVAHLPAAGEIVIFDRSWYNRAGVEHVMGFCTEDEYHEFLRSCPELERLLVRSGLKLIKYWLSVSDDEQEKRFQQRASDPTKLWKLSPMDLLSRQKWVEYSRAKDVMLEYTDLPHAPWYQIESDDKRRAHLNCIRHLLSLFPDYVTAEPEPVKLEARPPAQERYVRPPRETHAIVPDFYSDYQRQRDT